MISRRLIFFSSMLFAGACCAPLRELPAKQLPFAPGATQSAAPVETSEVWHDAKRNRDVPVKVYAPANAHGRAPVVVVSHGIGEDRDSYAYLGRAFARAGFLTVHVTHAGTDRAVLERGYRHLYRAVKQRENWINRPLDVSFVLDRLASRADADVDRAAVVGHSAGAFTAFALAGMRTADGGDAFRDPRIKVAVPISMPKMDGVVPRDGYDSLAIPLLNLTGTCDTSLVYRTFPKHRRIPFDSTRSPRQYLVTLEGVNHDTFSAPRDRFHDAIAAVTVAFVRAWLQDDTAARAWFDDPGSGVVAGVKAAVERKDS
jgi:predicted dienelactone hydrolase